LIRKNKINILKVLPSIFKGNTFSINLFLYLSLSAFIIGGYDLSREIANEKDEINFVLDNLEDGCNVSQITAKGLGDIERPVLSELRTTESYISNNLLITSISDRGPPAQQ